MVTADSQYLEIRCDTPPPPLGCVTPPNPQCHDTPQPPPRRDTPTHPPHHDTPVRPVTPPHRPVSQQTDIGAAPLRGKFH